MGFKLYVAKKNNIRFTPCPNCGLCSLKYAQWKSTYWKDESKVICKSCGKSFKSEKIKNMEIAK